MQKWLLPDTQDVVLAKAYPVIFCKKLIFDKAWSVGLRNGDMERNSICKRQIIHVCLSVCFCQTSHDVFDGLHGSITDSVFTLIIGSPSSICWSIYSPQTSQFQVLEEGSVWTCVAVIP